MKPFLMLFVRNSTQVGTGSTYSAANFANGDQVYATVTSSLACATGSPASSNTLSLTVYGYPEPDLGNDTTIAASESLVLDAGNGYLAYLWSTGETTQTISVSETGLYSVTVYNDGFCEGADSIQVQVGFTQLSGIVYYDNEEQTPLNGVTVFLKQAGATVMTTVTDANGHYSFADYLPGTYSLDFQCTKVWGGSNSTDALFVLRHFVNMGQLTGIRFIAADINASNTLNSIDALTIQKRFVGVLFSFPVGDWVFEKPVLNLNGNSPVIRNIKGLCSGDVNGSYLPPPN